MEIADVIHGDIKPDNVLVFDTVSGGIHVKLIDFGYSSLYTGPNDTNRVPATRPWNAPEWHTRGFSSDAARKMDVYSYGLLCLWLLLHSSLAFQPGSKIRDLLFPQRPGWMLQDVERFKKDSTLLDVLGREICCSDPWLQSQLQNIFKATLKKDPRNRDATLETCRRTFESIVHGPVGTGSTATQVQNPAESEPIMSVENANTDQNAPSINKSPQSLPTHIDLDVGPSNANVHDMPAGLLWLMKLLRSLPTAASCCSFRPQTSRSALRSKDNCCQTAWQQLLKHVQLARNALLFKSLC